MKLDRNITNPRRGKYALIKLRESSLSTGQVAQAKNLETMVTVEPEAIDFGDSIDTDFFVIRLKDKYAADALHAYADAAFHDDEEYANEIRELARLATQYPFQKRPD